MSAKDYIPAPVMPFDSEAFNTYLVWLRKVSRLYIRPAAFESTDLADGRYPDDQYMAKLDYNKRVREGRGNDPTRELRYVVCFSHMHLGNC
jgi:hypothetical protein